MKEEGPEGSGSATGYSQSAVAAQVPRKVMSAELTSHLDFPSSVSSVLFEVTPGNDWL